MLRLARNYNQFSLSGKYATALYQAGTSQNQLPAIKKDIADLHSKLNADEKARSFFENPTMSIAVKQKWVKDIASKFKYNKVTGSFLDVIVENKRDVMLSKILDEFMSLVKQKDGIVDVIVTSPASLTPKELDQIKSRLVKIVKGTIQISNAVNPDIKGGFIVEFGDYLIDLSVVDKVNTVKNVILAQ
eukprot:NODE_59_length_28102_cov_0.971110.p19 type:complete len:188 gc:universal NODE_59_length_28102_cov_0.971110:12194-11631(-)